MAQTCRLYQLQIERETMYFTPTSDSRAAAAASFRDVRLVPAGGDERRARRRAVAERRAAAAHGLREHAHGHARAAARAGTPFITLAVNTSASLKRLLPPNMFASVIQNLAQFCRLSRKENTSLFFSRYMFVEVGKNDNISTRL